MPLRLALVRVKKALPLMTAGIVASACLDNRCEQIDENPVRFTGGHSSSDGTFYQSSRPGEPLLRFPAARKFHLEHGLRSVPVEVSVMLSFDRAGKSQALAAGNEARLYVTPEYIEVFNDTCADFFVRVTARTEPMESNEGPPPATDAAPMNDSRVDDALVDGAVGDGSESPQ